MKPEELIEIANQLSAEDVCGLIEIFSNRMFVDVVNNCTELDKLNPVCMNGSMIQINLEEDQSECYPYSVTQRGKLRQQLLAV